jgi:hypothetical protein
VGDWLKRWPLLLVGLTIIGAGIGLLGADQDPSDARALLLGIGASLVGAGIVQVVRDEPRDPPPE